MPVNRAKDPDREIYFEIFLIYIAVALIMLSDNTWLVVLGWFLIFGAISSLWDVRKRLKKLKPVPEAMLRRTESALRKLELTEPHVFVDTETTGLSYNDEIIEIAVVSENGEVLLDTLIKHTSRAEISKEAWSVHGIKKRHLKKSPSWDEIYPQFLEAVDGKNILTYNASFDQKLINQTCDAWDLPNPSNKYLCVMKAYAAHVGKYKSDEYRTQYKWWKLEDAIFVYPECAIGGTPHRALVDCEQTRRLTKKLKNVCNELT